MKATFHYLTYDNVIIKKKDVSFIHSFMACL